MHSLTLEVNEVGSQESHIKLTRDLRPIRGTEANFPPTSPSGILYLATINFEIIYRVYLFNILTCQSKKVI